MTDSNDYFKALLRDILARYGASYANITGEPEGKAPADSYEAYQILTPIGDEEGDI